MSADQLHIHHSINGRGLRRIEERYDGMPTVNGRRNGIVESCPRFYENPFKHARKRSPSPEPQINRIHSLIPSKRSAKPPIIPPNLPPASIEKENFTQRPKETSDFHYATNSTNSWSTKSPPIRSPHKKIGRGPSTLASSNNTPTDPKPLRSILVNSSSIPPHGKQYWQFTGTDYKGATTSDQIVSTAKANRAQGTRTTRHAQGHKAPLRARIPENVVTTQDFDCHRREVHTVVSTLGSRVGALENTIAAALPVIAEARLLWIENAIIRNPTKFGTTRRAFCECYGHTRYETYTKRIRTRAYFFGLTLEDLDYLQERLDSLGSQSANHGTLLISPFGGANELGDKTMVEAYRQDSKHGAYARRVWRVCYERAYSVDEGWMLPVPIPDNPTLVEKIKGWFHE